MSTDLSTSTIEDRIAERIDLAQAQNLPISVNAGGMTFSNMSQVFEFAKMMAIGGIAVRKHLRGNPGACLAVTIQAIEWRMSPFAVANKSYSVNDQLAYEAQLIHAVILMRAPIVGRPKVSYSGEGDQRKCKVWAVLDDGTGETVEYESPAFGKITPKNSPLWKSDPDQQHFYYSVRAFARRHFPDIILGVYAVDEIATGEESVVTTTAARPSMVQALDHLAAAEPTDEAEVILQPAVVEPEKPKRERRTRAASSRAPEPEAAAPPPPDPVDHYKTGGVAHVAEAADPVLADQQETAEVEEAEPVYVEIEPDLDPPTEEDGDDEAEAIFTRMENLDVAPRGIDQSDVDQCRMFLEGHDAAHAKHPRGNYPAELKQAWAESQDARTKVLIQCWLRGHDAVTGFVPPKPQPKEA